jgi:ribonuclease HII
MIAHARQDSNGPGPPAAAELEAILPRTRAEVLAGLLATPRALPCRLFYDETGARLFEQISELDEYYLTRAELAILRQHGASIAAASIVAKVTRDRMMSRACGIHPGYGFSSHMGYATEMHRSAILAQGRLQRIHRMTFGLLRETEESPTFLGEENAA